MDRLTTDKQTKDMNMYELAHNGSYIDKYGNTRYRDYEIDVDARALTRELLKKYAEHDDAFADDDDFDNAMMDLLQYGTSTIEGMIALFYRNLWAMAELRETLKQYEDLGTVEEFKGLKGKQTPKKILYRKQSYGTPWLCPECEADQVKVEFFCEDGTEPQEKHTYCWKCGQKVDWNNE